MHKTELEDKEKKNKMTRDGQCLLLCWPTILGELNEVDLPVFGEIGNQTKMKTKQNMFYVDKITTAWGKRGLWITYEVCDPSPWIKFFSWWLTSAASSFPSFWQLRWAPLADLIFPAWKRGGGDQNWWFHIIQLGEIKAGLLISPFPLLPNSLQCSAI